MGVYIKHIEKPKFCKCEEYNCFAWDDEKYKCKITEWKKPCPLIEIDLEKDIPTIWYNRQTGLYEPKGTKREVYERLYKLKNGERRADEHTD